MDAFARLMSSLEATGASTGHPPGLAADGAPTLIFTEPDTAEQAAAVVSACSEVGARATPAGGCGLWRPEHLPAGVRPAVVVSTRRLARIIDYPESDLTVTVQAGISLGELDRATFANGQELAVCVPHRDLATAGGLLAVNPMDPCRRAHGILSDCVLGAEMILADGLKIRSGARTVKSVAGYDLHKLVVGSHGALALLTQVSLRLRPRASTVQMAHVTIPQLDDALNMAMSLLGGATRPLAIELLAAREAHKLGVHVPEAGWCILIGYAGPASAVDWQMRAASKELAAHLDLIDPERSRAVLQHVADFPASTSGRPFEIELLRQNLSSVLQYCGRHGLAVIADAAARGVRGTCPGGTDSGLLEGLRRAAGEHALLRCLGVDSARTAVSKPLAADFQWMRSLKRELDPQSVFPMPDYLVPGTVST